MGPVGAFWPLPKDPFRYVLRIRSGISRIQSYDLGMGCPRKLGSMVSNLLINGID